ncbi:hypothetical protein LTR28_006120, partial [Elasticomyces elasticus]
IKDCSLESYFAMTDSTDPAHHGPSRHPLEPAPEIARKSMAYKIWEGRNAGSTAVEMLQRRFLDLKIDERFGPPESQWRDLHVYAHTLLLNEAATHKALTEQYQNARLSAEELGYALKVEKLDDDVLHRPLKHALMDNEEVKRVSEDMKFDDIKLGIVEFADERDGLKEDNKKLTEKIKDLAMERNFLRFPQLRDRLQAFKEVDERTLKKA